MDVAAFYIQLQVFQLRVRETDQKSKLLIGVVQYSCFDKPNHQKIDAQCQRTKTTTKHHQNDHYTNSTSVDVLSCP